MNPLFTELTREDTKLLQQMGPAKDNSPSVANTSNPISTQTKERENLSSDSNLKSILEKAQESMRNR